MPHRLIAPKEVIVNNVSNVLDQSGEVPFAMRYMQQPQEGDSGSGVGATMTTTYSTDCGPGSSPDDGATDSKDD